MMSSKDTLESVFSAIYHLNELNCLDYSTWANLKEKMELSIKREQDELYNKIKNPNDTTVNDIKMATKDNTITMDNFITFEVNGNHYYFNKRTGKVFKHNTINDTNLPEKS